MSRTEDHFACLCEVIALPDRGRRRGVANLARQQAFFARHIQPWGRGDVRRHRRPPQGPPLQRRLAGFTRAFLSVEGAGLDLLDS
ncbi:hypothetical protein [Candidatus Skiveiella danica]|uniref:hypothetical protein n=1 Tax=Candidatus Skiveiella danica TaxID=3386177 RepID=UPI0039B9955C